MQQVSPLKCSVHKDQNIINVSLGVSKQLQRRALCPICIQENILRDQPCSFKKIPSKAQEFTKSQLTMIQEKYNSEEKKINQIIKSLCTMRDSYTKIFDDLIKNSEKILQQLCINFEVEQKFYQNLTQNLSITKLEELANLLSGSKKRESLICLDREECSQFYQQILINFNQFMISAQDELNNIQGIIYEKILTNSQQQLENDCHSLACNQKQKLIVGGLGSDVIVWQQKELELIQTQILTGHPDTVSAIIIYNSGNVMISGCCYGYLALWEITDSIWNCIQSIQEHTEAILDLQLTKKEDQVISASRDKSIKIWIMSFNRLQCVQTLNEHTYEVGYVSISSNQQLMATSSFENYFIVFKSQSNNLLPWKKHQKIETEGVIKRIYVIDQTKIICQQQTPPKLIIYECNEQFELYMKQQFTLNEPDNGVILFPIFEGKGQIYCKNDKFVYVINKSTLGTYYIRQIICGHFYSGCADNISNSIIMGNCDNMSLEFYPIV